MVEITVFGPFPHGASAGMTRADLELYSVNHFRPSFVGHVFFNDPDITEDNWIERRPSLAARFAVFGHQRCVGDEGHCEVPTTNRRFDDRRDAFDSDGGLGDVRRENNFSSRSRTDGQVLRLGR